MAANLLLGRALQMLEAAVGMVVFWDAEGRWNKDSFALPGRPDRLEELAPVLEALLEWTLYTEKPVVIHDLPRSRWARHLLHRDEPLSLGLQRQPRLPGHRPYRRGNPGRQPLLASDGSRSPGLHARPIRAVARPLGAGRRASQGPRPSAGRLRVATSHVRSAPAAFSRSPRGTHPGGHRGPGGGVADRQNARGDRTAAGGRGNRRPRLRSRPRGHPAGAARARYRILVGADLPRAGSRRSGF